MGLLSFSGVLFVLWCVAAVVGVVVMIRTLVCLAPVTRVQDLVRRRRFTAARMFILLHFTSLSLLGTFLGFADGSNSVFKFYGVSALLGVWLFVLDCLNVIFCSSLGREFR